MEISFQNDLTEFSKEIFGTLKAKLLLFEAEQWNQRRNPVFSQKTILHQYKKQDISEIGDLKGLLEI